MAGPEGDRGHKIFLIKLYKAIQRSYNITGYKREEKIFYGEKGVHRKSTSTIQTSPTREGIIFLAKKEEGNVILGK